jgi:hypothetical protein
MDIIALLNEKWNKYFPRRQSIWRLPQDLSVPAGLATCARPLGPVPLFAPGRAGPINDGNQPSVWRG